MGIDSIGKGSGAPPMKILDSSYSLIPSDRVFKSPILDQSIATFRLAPPIPLVSLQAQFLGGANEGDGFMFGFTFQGCYF
jgi:hypothetical protein